MEERDKKLLELVVENPDIFDARNRAIKEIFSEEGFLSKGMSKYIEKKESFSDIEIGYYPEQQQKKILEVHTHFYLKGRKDYPYFTIMYYTDVENNKKNTINSLELLQREDVQYKGKFVYEPSFAPCWSEVWWNNKHPVYELEHKLYEDGFEKEFLDKAKKIFQFVEKALKP